MNYIEKAKKIIFNNTESTVFRLEMLHDQIGTCLMSLFPEKESFAARLNCANSLRDSIFEIFRDNCDFESGSIELSDISIHDMILVNRAIDDFINSSVVDEKSFSEKILALPEIVKLKNEVAVRSKNYFDNYGNFPLSTYLFLSELLHGNAPVISKDFDLNDDGLSEFVEQLIERHQHDAVLRFITVQYPFGCDFFDKDYGSNMSDIFFNETHKDLDAFELKMAIKGNHLTNSGEAFLLHCVFEVLVNKSDRRIIIEMIKDRIGSEKEYFKSLGFPTVQVPYLSLSKADSEKYSNRFFDAYSEDKTVILSHKTPMFDASKWYEPVLSGILPESEKLKTVSLTSTEMTSNVLYYASGSAGSGIGVAMMPVSLKSIAEGNLAIYFVPKEPYFNSGLIYNSAVLYGRIADVHFVDASDLLNLGKETINPLNRSSIVICEYDFYDMEIINEQLKHLLSLIVDEDRDLTGASLTIYDENDHFNDLYESYCSEIAQINNLNCSVVWCYKGCKYDEISPSFFHQFKTVVLMRSRSIPEHLDASNLELKDVSELSPGSAYVFKLGRRLNDQKGLCDYTPYKILELGMIYDYVEKPVVED